MIRLCSPDLVLVNTAEVVSAMTLLVDLDQSYLDAYFNQWFDKCRENLEANQLNIRKGIKLMAELAERKVFSVRRRMDLWTAHAEQLENVRGVKELHALLGIQSAAGHGEEAKA